MSEIATDLTFATGYDVGLLHELPTSSTKRFYIPALDSGGRDGMLLRITPDSGDGWIGCFAFGQFGIDFSAVIASPEPYTSSYRKVRDTS